MMIDQCRGKHLVLFSANFLPNVGGIETFTDGLSRQIASEGGSVLIVTNNLFDLSPYEQICEGVDIIRLPCLPFMGGRLPIPKFGSVFKELWKMIADYEADAVVVNARFYVHSLLGVRLARLKRIRPIIIDHGSTYITMNNTVFDLLLRAYEHAFTCIEKKAGAVFCGISRRSVEWLHTFGIKDARIITNAIDAAAFVGSASSRSFRKEIGIPDEEALVVFTGRLIKEKGVPALLDAANLLTDKPIHFAFAGAGPLQEWVATAGTERVHLLGRLNQSDLASLLLESNLFCLPSRSEGFCNSLLEASACGVPSLITDVGIASNLICNSEYGTILKDATGAEIAARVDSLCSDLTALRLQGERVKCRATQLYSWGKSVEDLLAVINDSIALR